MANDTLTRSGEKLRQLINTTERGMGAVQEMIAVLRECEREMLALHERIRELEALCWSDEITGLPNRRGLDDQMGREEARARRYGSPVAVALLAVDGAKAVSERYGPLSGDALMRAMGAALRAGARGSDMVAHCGNGAFVVLLSGADLTGGQAFVDRLRFITRFAKLPTGDIIPITFADAIASRDEAGTVQAALELAEHRLLLNKSSREAPVRVVSMDGVALQAGD